MHAVGSSYFEIKGMIVMTFMNCTANLLKRAKFYFAVLSYLSNKHHENVPLTPSSSLYTSFSRRKVNLDRKI